MEEKKEFTELITIAITYKSLGKCNAVNARKMRTIDIYMEGEDKKPELVYAETESVKRHVGKAKNGIAGAVNLLHGLLLEHDNVYYINDEKKLLKEMSDKFCCRNRYCTQKTCGVGKRFNFFGKLRLQLLQLQIKFFDIFK